MDKNENYSTLFVPITLAYLNTCCTVNADKKASITALSKSSADTNVHKYTNTSY